MAGPNFILDKGFISDSAVTKFRAVKMVTPGDHVTAATVLGEAVIGVTQHDVAAADAGKQVAGVRLIGITKMEAGATVAFSQGGTKVRVDATGRAVALAGTAGVNENVVGLALTGGAVGEWIDVLLTPGTSNNTAIT